MEKKRIKNVALLSLTSENSYAGLGPRDVILMLKAMLRWAAVLISRKSSFQVMIC